jgi:hypothetical protein
MIIATHNYLHIVIIYCNEDKIIRMWWNGSAYLVECNGEKLVYKIVRMMELF